MDWLYELVFWFEEQRNVELMVALPEHEFLKKGASMANLEYQGRMARERRDARPKRASGIFS
ncbi:MAG: hypothetical protein ACLR0N_17045 [Bilophila wadsworthia]